MNILDMRTVLFSYVVTDAICAIVMGTLWLPHRRRSPELGLWLADFVMQFLAVLLIVLRGTVPDWASIVIGGALVIGGTLLLYIGLERYVDKPRSQRHNYVLFALFILTHAYFTFVQPSLFARNLNFSLALLVFCSQCAWLMLRRVDAEMRPATKFVGVTFGFYSLVSVARIVTDVAMPPGNDLFKSGLYDTLVILTYQMLFIGLTFALFLMVNRRLSAALERDAAERKVAEDTLRESEERYRTLAKAAHDLIFVMDRQGGMVYINSFAASLFHLKPEEIVGRKMDEFFPRQVADRQRMNVDKVFATGEPLYVEAESRFPPANMWLGTWLVPIMAQGGQVSSVMGISRDITERKRAEAALRESEERHRSLFDNMLNGFAYCRMLFDDHDRPVDFVYLAVNSAFERITDLKGVVGKPVSEVIPGLKEQSPELLEAYGRVALTGRPEQFEIELKSLGMWLFISVYSLEKGTFVAVFDDITERKRAEATRLDLQRRLQQAQKAESLRRMAGAIAHHYNNLLAAVMGNLELAMDDLPPGAPVGGLLSEAMIASRKAADVSAMMLTYLGQAPGTRELLDLSEACRQSLPTLRAAMPTNVDLQAELPSRGPIIRANRHQVVQVLGHLVTNAWEALGDGRDAIHLAVRTVAATDIPATRRFPADWQPEDTLYACLEVADAGSGIAHQDMEKLFDPFFTTKFAGRGLSLPVVLGVVRAHGGVVTVESELGRGAIFRVFLPVSTEPIPRQPEPAVLAPPVEGGGTMLLVEDDEGVRKMAQLTLVRQGFAVLEARDGIEAVEVFRQHQSEIRFVLCDLTMPRMDGWQTLAALRQLSPAIPVILASGYDQAQVMAGEHAQWPQAFLGKPYRTEQLREAIRQALRATKAEPAGPPV